MGQRSYCLEEMTSVQFPGFLLVSFVSLDSHTVLTPPKLTPLTISRFSFLVSAPDRPLISYQPLSSPPPPLSSSSSSRPNPGSPPMSSSSSPLPLRLPPCYRSAARLGAGFKI